MTVGATAYFPAQPYAALLPTPAARKGRSMLLWMKAVPSVSTSCSDQPPSHLHFQCHWSSIHAGGGSR
eukprot:1152183-Pelagomonas_calceolata.AAC.12